LQNSAIWSNDNAVLSSSQTAVAFGIKGAALAMAKSPLCFAPWAKLRIISDDRKVGEI
jgi:hypothetical protein